MPWRHVSLIKSWPLVCCYPDGIEVGSGLSSILCQLGHSLRFFADCLLDFILCCHVFWIFDVNVNVSSKPDDAGALVFLSQRFTIASRTNDRISDIISATVRAASHTLSPPLNCTIYAHSSRLAHINALHQGIGTIPACYQVRLLFVLSLIILCISPTALCIPSPGHQTHSSLPAP